jgi:hypothetical protein
MRTVNEVNLNNEEFHFVYVVIQLKIKKLLNQLEVTQFPPVYNFEEDSSDRARLLFSCPAFISSCFTSNIRMPFKKLNFLPKRSEERERDRHEGLLIVIYENTSLYYEG